MALSLKKFMARGSLPGVSQSGVTDNRQHVGQKVEAHISGREYKAAGLDNHSPERMHGNFRTELMAGFP